MCRVVGVDDDPAWQQESPVSGSCGRAEQQQNLTVSQHENIHHPLPRHLSPGSDQARQGGISGGGEAPAAQGGALLLRQDCWRRGNSQDRGEHLQLGQ